LRDALAVGDRRRHVGEQRLHLRLGLEVLLAREALDAPRVGQRLAFGHAHTRLVGVELVGARELHRVRRHHRQPELCRQRHRGAHVRLVRRRSGALQLDVEAPGIQSAQALCQRGGAFAVTRQQRATDRAGVGARQRDQAGGAVGEPLPLHPGLRALHVARPGARQQVAQVVIAGGVAHQQQQARRLLVAAAGHRLDPEVDADDRLDAIGAACAIELDGTEQVPEVGDRQRHLCVLARGAHRIGHAQRAIDHRILGVRAQVDKSHRLDCRQRARPQARRRASTMRPHFGRAAMRGVLRHPC